MTNEVIDQPQTKLSRRAFLQASAAVGGGLLLAVELPGVSSRAEAAVSTAGVGVWVRIGTDETVTIVIPTSEMGQGVLTSLPQLIAEELRVDWSQVRTEHAPAGTAWGARVTGGSSSVRTRYLVLRRAGAAARDMLIRAAATAWGVSPSACVAQNGKVLRTGTSSFFTYGQLAPLAATLQPSTDTAYLDSLLTPDGQMTIIGKSVPRPDIPLKVDGSAVFGIDVRVPGMLYAAVKHCPTLGGTLKSTPRTPSGALKVVPLKNAKGVVNAVAVVAKDTWSAMRAARGVSASWNIPAANATLTSAAISQQAQQLLLAGTPVVAENSVSGNPSSNPASADVALGYASKKFEYVYELPYLAHNTIEPLNCTALVTATSCQIWAPTQAVSMCQSTAATLTGLPQTAITVTNTFLGSGLGRKFEQDYISQAVQIAMAMPGTPVKLTWSREEDSSNDQYRPMALCRVQVGTDEAGNIVSWINRNVSPGILYQRGTPATSVDSQAVEGARNLPYRMGARRVEHVAHPAPVPVGFWRSVGSSINAFVVESAIDELAAALGKDPYQYRRDLLADDPRALRVLDAAAQMAGWGRTPAAGHALGISLAESFNTIVCEVAEISATATGVRVHNVWCAVDCGKVINPDTVKQQIEGGMVLGLTAAMWGKITWANGAAVEKNFNRSRKLRMGDMPACEVQILETPGAVLGGIGEPGTPPIAGAVANAYARLTGKRIRTLPMFPSTTTTGG